jgi:hypothetical protein
MPVERFCQMSPDELELLVAIEGLDLDDAAYPPRCDPPRGPLRIREHDRGGIKLEVSPRRLPLDDFALTVLFQTGSCIFGGAEHLARFFRGPVAESFGIQCAPLPRAVAEAPPDDETVEPPPGPRERGAARRRRVPSADELASTLARSTHGQEAALARIARSVTTQIAKRHPARPESMLLVGPTGTGKTSTVEAVPEALEALGCPGLHVFRIDCGELVSASDLRRVLGAPPSYIGYVEEPPLVAALREPGCILLLDEVEKADDAVHDVFLGLLDDGRLTAPDGETVEAPGAVVALTTNLAAVDLAYRLRDVPVGSRAEQAVCRDHLLSAGWSAELVGRIGVVAVFDELSEESRRGVATNAIHDLAEEFGFTIEDLPGVLADVVCDLADSSEIGARAVTYAARDLLADALADAARRGVRGPAHIDPGPPPRVVQTRPS